MELLTTSAAIDGIDCDLLALAIRKDGLDDGLAALDDGLAADLEAAATDEDFDGATGSSAVYATLGRLAARRVALIGVGDGGADGLRRGAGAAAAICRSKGFRRLVLAFGDLDAKGTMATVEGVHAGAYVYDRYKPEDKRKAPLESVAFTGDLDADAMATAHAIAAGQRLARDLVNAPAADIYPESLALEAAELALTDASEGTLSVEVWDEARIRDAGMGGIIAVGQGSVRKPRFVHMTWKPAASARKKLVLVGKGVTFDSGGLSLKTSAGMQTMRCDMGGSAAVVGAMRAVRDLRPDVEVHGIFAAAENMNDGGSYKLGDILSMHNGKTVEIHNTDAEGRLVLADCLSYADALGADAIIDLATLTGACIVALGKDYTGLFTAKDDLAGQLQAAAEASGEGLWRLPLAEQYKDQLKAEWGLVKNVGGREGGSITAALFLSEFVENTPWAHCDIAGPAFRDKSWRHLASGGTGAMVPTLVRWILS